MYILNNKIEWILQLVKIIAIYDYSKYNIGLIT